MWERVGPRLTYANVMSSVAAFLALGGGVVWAAEKIGSDDIKPKAVRAKHIKSDAVRSRQIREEAVGPSHLVEGIPRDVVVVRGSSSNNSMNKSHQVECPGGRLPIAGGAGATGLVSNEVAVSRSEPVYVAHGGDINGWDARGIEVVSTTNSWDLVVWVTCARGVAPPD